MTYYEEMAAIGPRTGVMQIVPPSNYRDRLAQEGAPSVPAGGYPLTDHGGSTIHNPKLMLVLLGRWWGDEAKLIQFAADLMTCGYLAPLLAYGSGQGRFAGAFRGPPVSGTVNDADLQAALTQMIASAPAGFPAPDASTLYALILPDGVGVSMGGSQSCSAFCGYHDVLPDGKTFYTVQPSTNCQGCNEGDPFAAFTAVLAHEVAEACTDAIPGQGWYADANGMENADEYAWTFGPYGPWTVQGYHVNGVGNSLATIEYKQPQPGPNPNPNPIPNPQPTLQDRFGKWLVDVGNWWPGKGEGARQAEAQVITEVTRAVYPNVTTPANVVSDLATAPPPPATEEA